MPTHQDARTAADVRARMSVRAEYQAELRKRAEKLFREEPEMTAADVAARLGISRSAAVNWRREWRKAQRGSGR